ncbi:type VI secretion system tip protein VgrG [Sinomicrobium kalidii]|uniref:type VI secretion system Vgr family protein n=1 Tax=Sinomicrobium kalidii TaxID=2900738 RepID=UPI001E34150B|nr:phage baseplate assembly protein V [Sinomicrobium kalidii]UGU14788.1 type VI secretion system tip protein VgrG [Sinomicrobium kalidii]
MAIQTNIRISINGELLLKFSKLVIKQNVIGHHAFSIKQHLPKEFISRAIDKAQDYMGQPVHIEVQPKNLKNQTTPLVFKGLVTDVWLDRSRGAAGEVVISGTSPTVKLDGVPNTRSYLGKELSSIVQDTLGSHKESMKLNLQISRDTALDYTVQYKESDYAFLCRMARKKGEWFYYNGTELVFGKPQSRTFSLIYGQNVTRFNRRMSIKPMGFQYTGYDPEYAQTQKAGSGEVGYETQGLAQSMFRTSRKVFPDNGAAMYYHHPISAGNAQSHLHDRIRTQLHGRAAGLVVARGISTEPGLRIGDIVNVKEPMFSLTGDLADGVKEDTFGNYYVTSITHMCDETGNYTNEFSGVPDTVEAPPYTDVLNPPLAETQPAVVTDNNDPKGLGRVKVKFHWDYESPWIRMVQPHGGGSKGFYFIPEVGEEVLVAYEGGNAEKPYIVGTMYNGNQKSGYATANNDLKVIHSRSGTRIKMNDAEGSIFIEDPSGNTWFMDGQGNIEVSAPKNVSIRAGENMSLTAGKTLTAISGDDTSITAGKNLKETATADYRLQAANITEISDGEFRSQADTINNVGRSEMSSMSNEGVMNNHAKSKINNNSGEKGNLF